MLGGHTGDPFAHLFVGVWGRHSEESFKGSDQFAERLFKWHVDVDESQVYSIKYERSVPVAGDNGDQFAIRTGELFYYLFTPRTVEITVTFREALPARDTCGDTLSGLMGALQRLVSVICGPTPCAHMDCPAVRSHRLNT